MTGSKPVRPSAPLPNGASGVEAGDFVIEFLRDKIVFLAKGSGDHYTLHFGPVSGVIDVHRTRIGEDGTTRHETLFAIRHTDLTALLMELAPATSGMDRLFRRLRVGWMHRSGIGIVRGLEPTTDEELMAVTSKHPSRKRLVVVEDKLHANVHRPEYLDDVWDFPDGPFILFHHSRRIGIGFKTTDSFGQSRLFWVKLRDLRRFSKTMQNQLCEATARYALPPEDYSQYNLRN